MKTMREEKAESLTRKIKPYIFIFPFLALYLVFILYPIVGIVIKSFTDNNVAVLEVFDFNLLRQTQLTLENYRELFTSSWSLRVLGSTIGISTISVILALVIGTPIAYALTKPAFRSRNVVRWFLSLPVYLPIVITSFALVWFFGNRGVLNVLLESVGLEPIHILYTVVAVVLGSVAIIIPMYVRTIIPAFESIPQEVFDASLSLGANEVYTLVKVILPITKPTILSGLVLIFAQTIGMMEVAFLLGGGGMKVLYLSIEIYQNTLAYSPNIPFASAMAVVLLCFALAGQFFSMWLLRKGKKHEAKD